MLLKTCDLEPLSPEDNLSRVCEACESVIEESDLGVGRFGTDEYDNYYCMKCVGEASSDLS